MGLYIYDSDVNSWRVLPQKLGGAVQPAFQTLSLLKTNPIQEKVQKPDPI